MSKLAFTWHFTCFCAELRRFYAHFGGFLLQSLSQFSEGKKCVSAYSYAFCMFIVEADMEKEGKKEKRTAGEDGGV